MRQIAVSDFHRNGKVQDVSGSDVIVFQPFLPKPSVMGYQGYQPYQPYPYYAQSGVPNEYHQQPDVNDYVHQH